MSDFFTGSPSLTSSVASWTQPTGIDYNQTMRPDFGGVIGDLPGLSPASAPSPVQPGSEPGWASQWNQFFKGLGQGAAGIGAGIAAARGDMPMAGQLLSTYFQDKTGDKDESEESSLEKALRALKESGLISFNLDTGEDDSDKLMI